MVGEGAFDARDEDRRTQSFMGSSFKVTQSRDAVHSLPHLDVLATAQEEGTSSEDQHRCSLPRCIPRPRCGREDRGHTRARSVLQIAVQFLYRRSLPRVRCRLWSQAPATLPGTISEAASLDSRLVRWDVGKHRGDKGRER